MARKKKTILGQIKSEPAQKQFTDREEPQESFKKSLTEVNQREYSILTYYGVGGIGKSSLQKHLKLEHLDKDDDAIYSSVDFEIESNRTPHKTLRILAHNFNSKFKVKFSAFDIAYTIYWSKAFPDHDIKKDGLPFIEEGSQLASIIGLVEQSGGVVGTALGILDYALKKGKEFSFDHNVQSELNNLKDLDTAQVEKKLAMFFAYDIDTYKKKNPEKKIVIFLDTYEALWQNSRSEANRLSEDEWIRDFVIEMTNVLFVICGREKIRWSEVDSEWEADLNQHIIGNLSKDDAKSFLNGCEIRDPMIQNKMIESSKGLPYYLDLCVDTYFQIIASGTTPTVDDFSDVGKEKIFERFMRYLSLEEQETLKVLANAQFYNKEIFSLLIEKFKTGYPITAMDQLNKFSFISHEDEDYFINNMMKKSLLSFQSDDLHQDVNNYLFEYYNSKLQDLDIKDITEKSLKIIIEGRNHLEKLDNVKFENALSFNQKSNEIINILYTYDPTYWHARYIQNLISLANLYVEESQLIEAIVLLEEAEIITHCYLQKNRITLGEDYIRICKNLLLIYTSIGLEEKASMLLEKANETLNGLSK